MACTPRFTVRTAHSTLNGLNTVFGQCSPVAVLAARRLVYRYWLDRKHLSCGNRSYRQTRSSRNLSGSFYRSQPRSLDYLFSYEAGSLPQRIADQRPKPIAIYCDHFGTSPGRGTLPGAISLRPSDSTWGIYLSTLVLPVLIGGGRCAHASMPVTQTTGHPGRWRTLRGHLCKHMAP